MKRPIRRWLCVSRILVAIQVSIEAFDFTKEDQIFICLSFPFEIESIEQSFNSFIEAMK